MTAHTKAGWLFCLLSGILAPASASGSNWEKELDLKQLKVANISSQTESLIQYIKSHTLTPDRRKQIQSLIQRLGDDSWEVRVKASEQLLKIGRLTLPFLNVALQSKDREVMRRARKITKKMHQAPHRETMVAVVRTLARRQERRALPDLIACYASIRDEQEKLTFQHALMTLGLEQGKPHAVIVDHVHHEDPVVRAVCALVLGRAKPLPRKELELLLQDQDAQARFCAARSLIRAQDRSAIPVMIDLLSEMCPQCCWQVEDVLFQVAFSTKAPSSLQQFDSASRQKAVESWKSWWDKNRASLDLAKISFDRPLRGYTLYCEYDGGSNDGCVWMAGRDGKSRWEIEGLVGPNDAQLLPNGRVLIAERNAGRVTERDRKGNILWQRDVSGGAIGCERLTSGRTMITTWVSILMVDHTGKEIWKYTHPRGMRHARKVRGRRILGVAANGEVFFLSEQGKLLKRIQPQRYGKGAGYWASAELLPNGHILVALGSSEKVVEIDQTGKIVWEVSVPNAVHATRLRDGHTLICNFEDRVVLKLDRQGREVSRRHLRGRPFGVRHY